MDEFFNQPQVVIQVQDVQPNPTHTTPTGLITPTVYTQDGYQQLYYRRSMTREASPVIRK
jgi:hypothetical protein